MPNWCINNIVLEGKKEVIDEFEKNEFDFEIIRPMPKEVWDQPDVPVEIKGLEGATSPAWYDWRCKNWGTKWNRRLEDIKRLSDNSIQFNFQTAWGVPFAIFEFVTTKYDIKLRCDFDIELGNGAGHFTMKNGEISDYTETQQDNWMAI